MRLCRSKADADQLYAIKILKKKEMRQKDQVGVVCAGSRPFSWGRADADQLYAIEIPTQKATEAIYHFACLLTGDGQVVCVFFVKISHGLPGETASGEGYQKFVACGFGCL